MTYSNFHGNLPGYDNRKIRSGENNIDPDKAAFSMAPHDEEAYERVNADENDASVSGYGGYDENRYGAANPYSHDDDDPNRYGALPPRNHPLFDSDTEYQSGGGAVAPPSMPYSNPSGPSPYDDDQPAQFPAGDYDRVQR